MKKLKDIREQAPAQEIKMLVESSSADLPIILVAKRKALRMFPDGQMVGLYYIKAIDRFITVPHTVFGMTSEAKSTKQGRSSEIDNVISKYFDGELNISQARKKLKMLGVINPDPILREEDETIDEGAAQSISKMATSKAGRAVGKAVTGYALNKVKDRLGKNSDEREIERPGVKTPKEKKISKEYDPQDKASAAGRRLGQIAFRRAPTETDLYRRDPLRNRKIRNRKDDR